MENQEEHNLQYVPKDKKLKKERARKFRKKLAIACSVVGLSALLTNTLPIVKTLGGIDTVKNVSRTIPLWSMQPGPYSGINIEAISNNQYRGFFMWHQPGYGISFKFIPGSVEWTKDDYRVNALPGRPSKIWHFLK